MRRLDVSLSLDDIFVPGLRRGYTIIDISNQPGESDDAKRARVQAALLKVRNASLTLGKDPNTGGCLYLPNPRRVSASMFGWQSKTSLHRAYIELGGHRNALKVELATLTVWVNSERGGAATQKMETMRGAWGLHRLTKRGPFSQSRHLSLVSPQ